MSLAFCFYRKVISNGRIIVFSTKMILFRLFKLWICFTRSAFRKSRRKKKPLYIDANGWNKEPRKYIKDSFIPFLRENQNSMNQFCIFQSTNLMHNIEACSLYELIYYFLSSFILFDSCIVYRLYSSSNSFDGMALVAILLILSLSFQYQRLSQDFYSTICYLNNGIKSHSKRPINNCSQLTLSSIEHIERIFSPLNRFPSIESISFESKPVGRFI